MLRGWLAGLVILASLGGFGTVRAQDCPCFLPGEARAPTSDLPGAQRAPSLLMPAAQREPLITTCSATTWVSHTTTNPFGFNGFRSIKFLNNHFIAGQASSGAGNSTARSAISADGITWTLGTSVPASPTTEFYDFAYGNGIYVGVGPWALNYVLTSTDGLTWVSRTIPNTTTEVKAVTFGNGRFVAVGDDNPSFTRILTSTDGMTWVSATEPISASTFDFEAITYARNTFVVVGGTGSSSAGGAMTSPDGLTWTVRSMGASFQGWGSIIYAQGRFVVRGNTRYAYSNNGGVTWTTAIGGCTSSGYLAYGKGLFVHRVGASTRAVSRDGITWGPVVTVISGSGNNAGLAYGKGRFVGVTNYASGNANLWSSVD